MKNSNWFNKRTLLKEQLSGFGIVVCLVFVGAFFAGYYSARNHSQSSEEQAVTSTPVDVRASLFHNRDSVNYYAERAYKLDDPQGQFVVGACYYLRKQGDLPDDIYVVSHNEADSMLIFSAAQGYEPAINLIHCLHENGAWRWEY